MRVALVLRSGGEYRRLDVGKLVHGILAFSPMAEIVCLADTDVPCERIALRHDWPGWWAKMELFAPWVSGDLLYFDLDTVIAGDLSDIAAVRGLTLLRDFYRPDGLGSGMMFLPESDRAEIWNAWISDPQRHMHECRTREKWGDQGFLEGFWHDRADRWQDVLPGQVVSYKVHVRQSGEVPADARVVAFHGRPRPWEVTMRRAA